MWTAVIVSALGCYLLKLAGLSVPSTVLDRPVVRRIADLIPVALLGALVAVQTLSTVQDLTVDARLAGVGAGFVALLLKAPFLVVVALAAVATALLRARHRLTGQQAPRETASAQHRSLRPPGVPQAVFGQASVSSPSADSRPTVRPG